VSLEARLDELEQRLLDIEAEWARPEVASDPERSKSLGREQAQIGPIVENHRRLRSVRAEFEAARRDLHAESDPELKEMAREIMAESEAEEARLAEALRVQLLPKDPNDDRDVGGRHLRGRPLPDVQPLCGAASLEDRSAVGE